MTKKSKLLIGIAVIFIILVICIVFIINKSSDNSLTKNIQILVYDEKKILLYDEKKQTEKNVLIDVLKSLDDLDVKTETGAYGEYIVSINDKKQGDGYFWNYYINGQYAPMGVSSYKIKENDVYTFELEKFE